MKIKHNSKQTTAIANTLTSPVNFQLSFRIFFENVCILTASCSRTTFANSYRIHKGSKLKKKHFSAIILFETKSKVHKH